MTLEPRADVALRDPLATGAVALAGALVVTTTGLVLGNLPSVAAMRRDHGLVPATVDELAHSCVLVLAAVVGLAGRSRWRRWAAGVAALGAVEVALAWALDSGPVGLARSVAWRGGAAAVLAAVSARASRPAWFGRARWWALGAVCFVAGLGALGGLRGAIEVRAAGAALADGFRTSAGLAVVVVTSLTALVVVLVDDRRLAGLHTLAAGLLAGAAVAGDALRWLGESRPGSAVVLATRGAVALAAVAAGGVTVARRVSASGPWPSSLPSSSPASSPPELWGPPRSASASSAPPPAPPPS